MSTAQYQYQLIPLRDEIRILTLKRGHFDDPIHCSLQNVSLVDRPSYTALSYVWGDANNTLPITVDGTVFFATPNLKLALQYLRETDRDKILWVDAICINQNDIDERNNQLALMGKLYEEAEKVVIWLGEADETTEELVRVMHEPEFHTLPTTKAKDYESLSLQYNIRITRAFILISILALRPWWSRVWTVQECILPRSDPIFRCGVHMFSMERFFEFYSELSGNFKQIPNFHESLGNSSSTKELSLLGDRLRKDAGDPNNENVVSTMTTLAQMRRKLQVAHEVPLQFVTRAVLGRQAKVPHDYVYAVIGLVTSEVRENIVMDYRQSHLLVYREFFKMLLVKISGTANGCYILAKISFHKETDEQPSWVPDFSKQEDVSKYTGKSILSKSPFLCLEKVRWSNGDEILNLEGVCLDVVDQVYVPFENDGYCARRLLSFAERVREDIAARSEPVSWSSPPHELVEVSKRTHISQLFIGGRQVSDDKEESDAFIRNCWDIYAEYRKSGDVSTDLKTPRAELGGISPSSSLSRLMTSVRDVCRGRNIIISRAGISGIGVPHILPGDEIVCLYGFYLPFILRPRYGHYTIVGGVRLTGLADWVALTGCQKNGHLREATFRIR